MEGSRRSSLRAVNEFKKVLTDSGEEGLMITSMNNTCILCNRHFNASRFDHLFRYHLNCQYLDDNICHLLDVDRSLMVGVQLNNIKAKEKAKLLEYLCLNLLPVDMHLLYSCRIDKCKTNCTKVIHLKQHITRCEHYPPTSRSPTPESLQSSDDAADFSEEESSETADNYGSDSNEEPEDTDLPVAFSDSADDNQEEGGEEVQEGEVQEGEMEERYDLAYWAKVQEDTEKDVDDVLRRLAESGKYNKHQIAIKFNEEFSSRFAYWNVPKFQNEAFVPEQNEKYWLNEERTLSVTYGKVQPPPGRKRKIESSIVKSNMAKWRVRKFAHEKYTPCDMDAQFLNGEKTLIKQYITIENRGRNRITLSPQRPDNDAISVRRRNQLALSPRRSKSGEGTNLESLASTRRRGRGGRFLRNTFNKRTRKRGCNANTAERLRKIEMDDYGRGKPYHFSNLCLKCFKKFAFPEKFNMHDKDSCREKDPVEGRCLIWDVLPDVKPRMRSKNDFLASFGLKPIEDV